MSGEAFNWLNVLLVPTVALSGATLGLLWRVSAQLGGMQGVQAQHEIRISNLERKLT